MSYAISVRLAITIAALGIVAVVGALLDKLDASGRTDAVTHAARLGVIIL